MAGENPAGTFEQTDFETQTATEYKTDIDNNFAALHRVAGAFAPHETYEGSPSALTMKVTVDAGHIRSGATLTEVAAQATAALVAPASNPRIDRVVGDVVTGAISVVAGSEAASPSAPAIPAGKFPICQVALTVGQTTITNQAITDERALGFQVVAQDIVDGAVTQGKMASGVAVEIDSDGGSPAVYPGLRVKVIEIGDWNMDTTAGKNVAHGLTLSKIRSVFVLIRTNTDDVRTPLGMDTVLFGSVDIDATNIRMTRVAAGTFDNAVYNSTSYNRGFISVVYDENG